MEGARDKGLVTGPGGAEKPRRMAGRQRARQPPTDGRSRPHRGRGADAVQRLRGAAAGADLDLSLTEREFSQAEILREPVEVVGKSRGEVGRLVRPHLADW